MMNTIVIALAAVFLIGAADSCNRTKNIVKEEVINGGETAKDFTCKKSAVLDFFDVIDDICKELGFDCSAETTEKCNTYQREVSMGTQVTELGSVWNYYGGRGDLMARATLCTFAQLNESEVTSEAILTGLGSLGNFSVVQKVGLTSWKPSTEKVEAYRQVNICIPVIGCFDVIGQPFSLEKKVMHWTDGDWFKSQPRAGSHAIERGYSLLLSSQETDKDVTFYGPEIEIPSPVGPLTVQPKFNYKVKNFVIRSPYQNVFSTKRDWLNGTVELEDLYGRVPVIENTETPNLAKNGGWNSQLGLGQRLGGAFDWDTVNQERPDLNQAIPREYDEAVPNIFASASAELEYSPTKLLPEWMQQSPLKLGFRVFVKPELSTEAAAQFQIYSAEGYTPPKDVGSHERVGSEVRLMSKTGIKSDLIVDAGFDLNVKISISLTPFGGKVEKTLVNLKPRFGVPLFNKSTRSNDQKQRNATLSSKYNLELRSDYGYDNFTTFLGNYTNSSDALISSCYENPPVENPAPKPGGTAGDASGLFSDAVFPCNICVGTTERVDGYDDNGDAVSYPARWGLGQIVDFYIDGSNRGRWYCDQKGKIGCHDLCKMDKYLGRLVVVKSAVDNYKYKESEYPQVQCDAPRID